MITIEHIFVDKAVSEQPRTQRILAKLSGIPFEVLSRQEALEKIASLTVSQGKKNLWISEFLGPFLKPCPGTPAPYLCCNYWILNLQMNCPLDCSYCILQKYLNFPALTLFINLEKIADEIDELERHYPQRLLRIGTGELADSLALDSLTDSNRYLIDMASTRRMLLELKTKTSNMNHLPELRQRNIVVACSMNPPELIEGEEHKTASFEERLEALCSIAKKGYRLGIHLDPIIEIPNWQAKYEEMVERMTQMLNEEDMMWISMGTLRFPRKLKQLAEERFPKTGIFLSEFTHCSDKKMRYFRPIRTVIYQRIYRSIRKKWKTIWIYFCMEDPLVWERVMGYAPESNDHFDFLFHENIARRFPDLNLPKPDIKNYRTEQKNV